jgi:hypothetical protein
MYFQWYLAMNLMSASKISEEVTRTGKAASTLAANNGKGKRMREDDAGIYIMGMGVTSTAQVSL